MDAFRRFLLLLSTLALCRAGMGELEEALIPKRCPNFVKATIPGYHSSFSTDLLHQKLRDCPNVRALDLRLTLLGCTEGPERWTLPFRHGEKNIYPALTWLRLEGYRFHEVTYERSMAQNWFASTNLELWAEAMDWSMLETLDLVDSLSQHFVDVVWPHLGKLKHLSIRAWSNEDEPDAAEALIALPGEVGLESLSWQGPRKPGGLEKVLSRYGHSLKELDLGLGRPLDWAALTMQEVRTVQQLAPGLKKLSVVVERNGTWPLEMLAALAELESVEEMELGWQLETERVLEADRLMRPWVHRRENPYQQPELSKRAAEELFEVLERRRKETGQGATRLKRVVLASGNGLRAWDGPLDTPGSFEHERVRYECRRTLLEGEEVVCEARR
ncbi:uncharacterized protein B0I36DRAFT_347495 [Microdochium trichocladiopsis]|uniref:Uncharacterized protein n=1 Tax=Microdochium trichocladiopsis TaxID=1682393 RepID=A0A9P9BTR7_9PEZI|nr:uncharacterized protein B0I36DRAFT_347495 [Microdochium trichocladiopsis]KAH7035762.1 hypothetical protein B0I36DRAFT_347495 [Microdochium trichocladiopsis]